MADAGSDPSVAVCEREREREREMRQQATLPGIRGMADASTKERGLAGGDNRDKSPDDAMGVVAKVVIADDTMDVAGAPVKVDT